MDRYDPYYAQDTDGVHFQVNVDGVFVQAYVSRTILHIAYGSSEPRAQCLATYLEHREDIDSAVRRRVHAIGPETVLVRQHEIGAHVYKSTAAQHVVPRG
jgi:hypothetical protein